MSAIDDEAVSPHLNGDDSHDTSDAESGSSYVGSAAPDTPACPYQNTEFFGHECARYYDCPTHMVERDTTGENTTGSAAGTSNHTSQHGVTSPQLNSTSDGGTSAAGSNTDLNGIGAPMPEQAPPSIAPPSGAHSSVSTLGQTSSSSQPAISSEGEGSTAQGQGITLREALDGLSLDDETPSRSTPDARSPMPRDASRNATAQPTDSPETQRPASRLNPIAPSFSPRPERRSPQEIALPRWQPDSEVTFCPICHTQFSFFVRKHHCRKCGRVVCNACSPHMITIPHQYIVRPPGERSFQRYSFLGDEGGIADFSALGGGEKVRLCNPCVPDPNTTPPQTQHSASPLSPRAAHQRSQSSQSGNYYGDNNHSRYSPYMVAPNPPSDSYARNRSITIVTSDPPMNPNPTWSTIQNRIMSGTPPTYYPQAYSGYRHPPARRPTEPPTGPSNPLRFSSRNFMSDFNEFMAQAESSSSSMNRPLPPPPQIPEEDECPVCHRELPSRTLPNFEARRESHINSCITSHSSYSPGPDGRSGSREPRTPHRTGMFPYLATEKDCVDSAECTICLEEFEVGVSMARLECLCRFHRSCIQQWFVNHPGRCPVHQALQN